LLLSGVQIYAPSLGHFSFSSSPFYKGSLAEACCCACWDAGCIETKERRDVPLKSFSNAHILTQEEVGVGAVLRRNDTMVKATPGEGSLAG
jgi:hypothetical protein